LIETPQKLKLALVKRWTVRQNQHRSPWASAFSLYWQHGPAWKAETQGFSLFSGTFRPL